MLLWSASAQHTCREIEHNEQLETEQRLSPHVHAKFSDKDLGTNAVHI